MSTPEWSIFDRLDELEDITLKLMEKTDVTEPSLKDTSTMATDAIILALFVLGTAFLESATNVQNPRAQKDHYIDSFKQVGLSPKILEGAEKVLIQMCELIEEAKTSK